MKVLFLDVDGVLNCRDTFYRRHRQWLSSCLSTKEESTEYSWPLAHLDELLVPNLNTICEQTGCKIVLSSTWRLTASLNDFREWLAKKEFKYSSQIIDKTINLSSNEFVYCRGKEVQEWINKNSGIVSYVVVDDDIEDIITLHPNNTVQTCSKEGLTAEKALEVIAILNSRS
jgi:predicted AlkP superfamily phosphohydrolase/phosphomutase